MKKYTAPELNIPIISSSDIITTSGLAKGVQDATSVTRGSNKKTASALGLNC